MLDYYRSDLPLLLELHAIWFGVAAVVENTLLPLEAGLVEEVYLLESWVENSFDFQRLGSAGISYVEPCLYLLFAAVVKAEKIAY